MEESLSNIGFSKIGRDQADLIGQIEKLISVHDVVRSQPAFDQTKLQVNSI